MKKTEIMNIVAALTIVLVVMAAFTGCVAVNDTRTTASGTSISAEVFAQITPGLPQDQVVAKLGDPSEKTTQDGNQLWIWRYRVTQATNKGFIFVFLSQDRSTHVTVHYVEFKDGAVIKTWME